MRAERGGRVDLVICLGEENFALLIVDFFPISGPNVSATADADTAFSAALNLK
jgi:hypothetical protein